MKRLKKKTLTVSMKVNQIKLYFPFEVHPNQVNKIVVPCSRREIITVRGQSYVSRLPKY
jgi:hypothetical protein